MNGFIAKGMLLASLVGGLGLVGGCETYRNLVDPCYPQRYDYMARQEVCQSVVPQVNNGHILDQTVWNHHFEAGTERLTPGGMDHLAYLARRRPAPDTTIFLQTAQDLTYDPANPTQFADARRTLDAKRAQAIQNFLGAQTADRPLPFEVVVHDPTWVGMSAITMNNTITTLHTSATVVGNNVQNTAPGHFPGSSAGQTIGASGGR